MRWALFFTGLWAAAVATVWWWYVPFAPEYSLGHSVGNAYQINARELVTTRRALKRDQEPPSRSVGPLDVREISTGEILRSYLDADWQFVAFDYESRERLAVRNGSVVRIVRASDGSTVSELEPVPEVTPPTFAAAGKLLLVGGWGELSAYDTSTGQLKWKKAGAAASRQHVGPDLVVLTMNSGTAPPAQGAITLGLALRFSQIIDAETGEKHTAWSGNYQPTMFATRDGRLIVLRATGGLLEVHESASGKLLWALPQAPINFLWFNDEGTELNVAYRLSDGPVGVARWKSDDGKVLSPLPSGALSAYLQLSEDGRYAVEERRHAIVPAWIELNLRLSGLSKFADFIKPKKVPVIIDLETQTVLGRLSVEERVPGFQLRGPGFLSARKDGSEMAYYSFPPRRSMTWLAGWAFGPPALCWSIVWRRRRLRAVRTIQPAPA